MKKKKEFNLTLLLELVDFIFFVSIFCWKTSSKILYLQTSWLFMYYFLKCFGCNLLCWRDSTLYVQSPNSVTPKGLVPLSSCIPIWEEMKISLEFFSKIMLFKLQPFIFSGRRFYKSSWSNKWNNTWEEWADFKSSICKKHSWSRIRNVRIFTVKQPGSCCNWGSNICSTGFFKLVSVLMFLAFSGLYILLFHKIA